MSRKARFCSLPVLTCGLSYLSVSKNDKDNSATPTAPSPPASSSTQPSSAGAASSEHKERLDNVVAYDLPTHMQTQIDLLEAEFEAEFGNIFEITAGAETPSAPSSRRGSLAKGKGKTLPSSDDSPVKKGGKTVDAVKRESAAAQVKESKQLQHALHDSARQRRSVNRQASDVGAPVEDQDVGGVRDDVGGIGALGRPPTMAEELARGRLVSASDSDYTLVGGDSEHAPTDTDMEYDHRSSVGGDIGRFRRQAAPSTATDSKASDEPSAEPSTVAAVYDYVDNFRHEQLASVLTGLVQREEQYYKEINTMVRRYLRPMEDPSEREFLGITADQVDILSAHGGIQEVLALQTDVVDDLLDDDEADPISVFGEYGPRYAAYRKYIDNYDQLLTTFNALGSNKKFMSFLRLTRLSTGTKPFSASIIVPLQQIVAHATNVERLCEFADPNHASYDELEKAVQVVTPLRAAAQQYLPYWKRMSELATIQSTVTGLDRPIMLPNRALMKRGPAHLKKCRIDVHHQQATLDALLQKNLPLDVFFDSTPGIVFLFSDMILWTSEGYRWSPGCKLLLSGSATVHYKAIGDGDKERHLVEVNPNVDQHHGDSTTDDDSKTQQAKDLIFTMECASAEEAEEWQANIQKAVDGVDTSSTAVPAAAKMVVWDKAWH